MNVPQSVLETNEQVKTVLKDWEWGENEEYRRLLVRCRASMGWLIDHIDMIKIDTEVKPYD